MNMHILCMKIHKKYEKLQFWLRKIEFSIKIFRSRIFRQKMDFFGNFPPALWKGGPGVEDAGVRGAQRPGGRGVWRGAAPPGKTKKQKKNKKTKNKKTNFVFSWQSI